MCTESERDQSGETDVCSSDNPLRFIKGGDGYLPLDYVSVLISRRTDGSVPALQSARLTARPQHEER